MSGQGTITVLVDGRGGREAPVPWSVERLAAALGDGARVRFLQRSRGEEGADVVVAVGEEAGRRWLPAGIAAPGGPEGFLLAGGAPVIAYGDDARGAAYAVTELADRVRAEPDRRPPAFSGPVRGTAANPTRGVVRAFVNEGADKAWFHDERFWDDYLDLLAASRFNRLHLALGMGYDFHYQRDVTDTYFLFPYPYLLDVPGFDVAVEGLERDEQARNLAMLRLIGDQAVRRGLHFQLGLWTHGYEWVPGAGVNHSLRGLTPRNHAPYCRAAITSLLEECPSIGGVTLRVHGESGISEGSSSFWPHVFAGIADCGRRVEIDLHSKGLDHSVIDAALATGMPVVVSAKYAAEHMGLPYHLTDIRPHEQVPRTGGGPPGAPSTPGDLEEVMRLSAGSRVFTRYGYGDFLKRPRAYDVRFRIWPGTQRWLLWGDPAFASALGRSGGFGGATGIEVCEPAFFAGRRGTPAGHLRAPGGTGVARDHRFYEHTYRVLGRHLYDPGAPERPCGGVLAREHGEAGAALRRALAPASRILPLLTMAHCPSAANNSYWPELYTNMPIVAAAEPRHHYRDTALPRTFGSVTGLDAAMFSSIEEFAAEALGRRLSGRYTPLQVAGWLEQLAGEARARLKGARAADGARGARFEAAVADVEVLAGLGRFFAAKLRAGVLYEVGGRLGDTALRRAAAHHYRAARAEWAALADAAGRHHPRDVAFGPEPWLRGSWSDRLGAIDEDIAAMDAGVPGGEPAGGERARPAAWLANLEALAMPPAPASAIRLTVAPGSGGVARTVCADVTTAAPYGPARRVTMSWRPADQSRRFSRSEMMRAPQGFVTALAAAALDPRYPLQYFFTVETADGRSWSYPGLGADLLQRPYLVDG